MIRSWLAMFALLVAGCSAEAPERETADKTVQTTHRRPNADAPVPDSVRIRIETELGAIVVALDGRHAPLTTANFLAYADQGRFDGTHFYRAARNRSAPERGFIQGGIRRDYRRMLPPVAHEPTSRTGLRHGEGTISMARAEGGAGAMGEFFITANVMPAMDAQGDKPGFAVFGRVVEGMEVVRRILAAPTVASAGRGAMRGQMIARPVRIIQVRRADRTPTEGPGGPPR